MFSCRHAATQKAIAPSLNTDVRSWGAFASRMLMDLAEGGPRELQPVERAGLSWIERCLSTPLVLHERYLEWEGSSHDVTVGGSCVC